MLLPGTMPLTAAEAFAPGQVWTYTTRPGETQSRLVILRVDSFPKIGPIVHVAILNVLFRRAAGGVAEPGQISQARFSEAALRKSVGKLDPAMKAPAMPDFEEGYAKWKKLADEGNVQHWVLPVRDVVSKMEEWARQGKS
jgi:hypothetical protein